MWRRGKLGGSKKEDVKRREVENETKEKKTRKAGREAEEDKVKKRALDHSPLPYKDIFNQLHISAIFINHLHL